MSVYITYTACNRRYTAGLWKACIRIFTFVAGFLLCQVTCQYTVCILPATGDIRQVCGRHVYGFSHSWQDSFYVRSLVSIQFVYWENKGYNEWRMEGKYTDVVYFTDNNLWFSLYATVTCKFVFGFFELGLIRIESVSVIMILKSSQSYNFNL